MPERDLIAVALRLADGEAIDWSAHAAALSDDERRWLARLRELEAVGRLHGTVGPPDTAVHDSLRTQSPDGPEPRMRWGPLEIVDKVGRGSYGDVYRARDTRLGREVALKLLRHRERATSEDSLIREGHLLSRVRHPSVVTVYGAERIDGRTGLWMEFVHGETLEHELRRRGPLPPREVVAIGITLCDALQAVHAAGLLHRDIKAANVMRDRDGRLVLMDFGAGQDTEEASAPPGLAGTLLYLAPEVLDGGAASPQSDVYSLGVLLWLAATGTFPVHGRTMTEIRDAHGRRASSTAIPAGVPRGLAAVLVRATYVNPRERFANISSLQAALRVAAGDVPSVPRRAKGAIAALAVLGSIAVAGAVWKWRATSPPQTAASQPSSTPAGTSASPRGGDRSQPEVGARDPKVLTTPLAGSAAPPVIALVRMHEQLRVAVNIRSPSADPRFVTCTPIGAMAVAICDLEEGSIHVVREPPDLAAERSPAALLSPDGLRIAYLWDTRAGGTFRRSLRVVARDGSSDRELHRAETSAGITGMYHWTADGDAVLVIASHRDGAQVMLVPHDGRSPTVLRHFAGDGRALSANLSPDGRFLVMSVRNQSDEKDRRVAVTLLDTLTAREHQILDRSWEAFTPTWTPSGDGIVFTSNRKGLHAIYLQPMSGGQAAGEPILLRDMSRAAVILLGFSSDNALLTRLLVGLWDVFRAPIDLERSVLGAARRLDPSSIGTNQAPVWLGGGLMSHVTGEIGSSTNSRLVIRRANGAIHRERPFPGIYANMTVQRLSPDGSVVAVRTGGEKGPLLYFISLETGEAQLFERGAGAADFQWADADHLYLARGPALLRVHVKTGASESVYTAEKPWQIVRLATAPGGDRLAVMLQRADDASACTIRILDRGDVRERHQFENMWCGAIAWSSDGGRLIAAVSEAIAIPRTRPSYLMIMDAPGGDPTRIRVPGAPIVDFALSPDGRELLFTAGLPRPEYFRVTGLLERRR